MAFLRGIVARYGVPGVTIRRLLSGKGPVNRIEALQALARAMATSGAPALHSAIEDPMIIGQGEPLRSSGAPGRRLAGVK